MNADVGDEKIYNYHGYVAYNFGEGDAKVRPYVLGGLGRDAVRRRQHPHRRPLGYGRRQHEVLDHLGRSA